MLQYLLNMTTRGASVYILHEKNTKKTSEMVKVYIYLQSCNFHNFHVPSPISHFPGFPISRVLNMLQPPVTTPVTRKPPTQY